MVRGNQRIARECYSPSMKQKMVDNIHMDELDMRDEVSIRPSPSEELESVQLSERPEYLVYIGSKLAEDIKNPFIRFLKQNMEVFAWKQEDMGGIDPTVITHRLNVSPSFRPIKQKRRSFAPERQKTINEEVSKLLQANVIREVEYHEWLANVVLVKKENGKWRLCIDFTDINRACPKYRFPLPRIDLIVDATTVMNSSASWTPSLATIRSVWTPATKRRPPSSLGRNLLLSSNAFRTEERRSDLPKVGEQDVPKANWRIYGGIYRWHAGKIRKGRAPHNPPIQGVQVLKSYNMKLNLAKCAFGVSVGKFLGFIVNSRGIEANPDKIKVVLDMLPPSNIKDIQRLTGRIVALSRFVSKANEKCQPFFQVLKKAFQWDARS